MWKIYFITIFFFLYTMPIFSEFSPLSIIIIFYSKLVWIWSERWTSRAFCVTFNSLFFDFHIFFTNTCKASHFTSWFTYKTTFHYSHILLLNVCVLERRRFFRKMLELLCDFCGVAIADKNGMESIKRFSFILKILFIRETKNHCKVWNRQYRKNNVKYVYFFVVVYC